MSGVKSGMTSAILSMCWRLGALSSFEMDLREAHCGRYSVVYCWYWSGVSNEKHLVSGLWGQMRRENSGRSIWSSHYDRGHCSIVSLGFFHCWRE